jgi:hypothetical protein
VVLAKEYMIINMKEAFTLFMAPIVNPLRNGLIKSAPE